MAKYGNGFAISSPNLRSRRRGVGRRTYTFTTIHGTTAIRINHPDHRHRYRQHLPHHTHSQPKPHRRNGNGPKKDRVHHHPQPHLHPHAEDLCPAPHPGHTGQRRHGIHHRRSHPPDDLKYSEPGGAGRGAEGLRQADVCRHRRGGGAGAPRVNPGSPDS